MRLAVDLRVATPRRSLRAGLTLVAVALAAFAEKENA
jgi:hypothetical protein